RAWFHGEREAEVRTVLRDELPQPPARRATAEGSAAAADDAFSRVNVAGSAQVSFVIDQDGDVRVPFVTEADDPALGDAALHLVRSWRFEPPVLDDKPILVEDRRTFSFDPAARDGSR